MVRLILSFFFFFNDTATTEIYTLSLHDALPIFLLMLGMGLVFQMPAVTYVLARIGLVTAGWMLRVWRVAGIVIFIVAAVFSPTHDVPNMLFFFAPMFFLFAILIVCAWVFGPARQTG